MRGFDVKPWAAALEMKMVATKPMVRAATADVRKVRAVMTVGGDTG
jgi:hypothetical protein